MSTTNFEKFRQKMEQAKAKKSASASQMTWMKLESGKRYNVRFLPLKSENLELPFSLYNHHAITFPDGHFESIACPKKTNGEDCPFCNLASQLYRKYTNTDKEEYKEAAKKLFPKTHFLLVGFEPSAIDPADIKPEDCKVIRASSKANMDLIESKLAKEIDFVDFKTGRCVELVKSKASGKGSFETVVWDFADPSVAIDGKNGKALWEELVEKSPDLTQLITPMDADKLAAKFKEYMSQPIAKDDAEEDREVLEGATPASMAKVKAPVAAAKSTTAEDEIPFDLDDMRKALED
jgi:hypothetical protein